MTTVSKSIESLTAKRAKLGEVVGGGYIVFRRGKKTGRVGIKKNSICFEWPSYQTARAEANRLEQLNPGERFVVFRQVD